MIDVRLQQQPVNLPMFGASLSAWFAWSFWPTPDSGWRMDSLAWAAAATAGMLTFQGGRALLDNYRLRRQFAAAEEVSDDYGSARLATWDEIVAAGMDKPDSGNFLGLFDGHAPVFAPANAPFSLVEMPPGAGKTVNYVVGSILHQAELGASIVVPDPKLELGIMLGPKLEERGFEVWYANPTHAFGEACGDVELNPYQGLLDATYAEGDARLDAPKYAADYAELHYPINPQEQSPYFGHGSRRAIMTASLYQALVDPGHCTPTDAFRLIADARHMRKAMLKARDSLQSLRKDDPLMDLLRSEAANLLERATTNEENLGAFMEGAAQRLLPFNQAGRLGGYGRNAVHNIAELRDRQIILFIMSPLSHAREFSAFTSLLNHNILMACKTRPAGHRVHVCGEEFLNYEFKNLVGDLETLRGLKVTADFYTQSYAGLVRKHGREAAQAIESYADVKIYAGLTSYDRAKFVSDMLSEATIRRQDYSYQSVAKEISVSSRELGRRLMMPNEVLAMPRDQAWVFVRGMYPLLLTMAHYGEVAPWRDRVDANPLEGKPLRAAPRFTIHYPPKDDGRD